MIRKELLPVEDRVLVTFEIPSSVWAETINLVGDINQWDRGSLPFRRDRSGTWLAEVELERGREYRFRYLIDNDYWGYDWHADGHETRKDGGCDGVVVAEVVRQAA